MISIYNLSVYNPFNRQYEVFYVGQTNNAVRREKEHQRSSKARTETVYQTIRQIEKYQFDWEMFVLDTVEEEDYVAQEKEAVIDVLLLEEQRSEAHKHKFVQALYLMDQIEFNSQLSNMIMGTQKWKERFETRLKIMKDNDFKTIKELNVYLNEEKARLKSEKLQAKIIQESAPKKQSIKERIKNKPEFIEEQKQKTEKFNKAMHKAVMVIEGIKR